ncbi:MAG: hypothetical protein WHS86_06090 [Desulfosoma sp.]
MRAAALAVVVAAVLAGCAPVPRPAGHELSYQRKMQSARHWEQLAREVAVEVQKTLPVQGVSGIQQITVSADDRSDFGIAFRQFLMTRLRDAGYWVTDDAANPTVLRWRTQKVVHEGDRPCAMNLPYLVGSLLTLGMDYGGSLPRSEIILTVELKRSSAVLWNRSAVFYVNCEDMNHYGSQGPEVAGAPAQALGRTYGVVGR